MASPYTQPYSFSIRGLGTYMREIGKHLKADEPMSFEQAYHLIKYMDEGYAAAVLIRLRVRGVATQLDNYTYIRGPNWEEAARMYKWDTQ